MKRGSFDELIEMNVNAGRVTYDDLLLVDRYALTARYFRENGEWGDALFDDMDRIFEAFVTDDTANLGAFVSYKMLAYVRPYIEKQLRYMDMCKREQQEMADERRA